MRTLSLLALVLTTSGAAFAGSPWGADYFPNVALVNQDGAVVHFYDDLVKGKAVAVNLIYTHCNGTCPLETAKMAQVQKLLGDKVGKEIFFYSISIDPERDTPERLKAYAERYHVGPGWQFSPASRTTSSWWRTSSASRRSPMPPIATATSRA